MSQTGLLRLSIYASASAVNSGHAVEPGQYEPGIPVDEQADEHTLEFLLFDLNFQFEGMLSERFGWAVRLPMRYANCLLYTSPSPRD